MFYSWPLRSSGKYFQVKNSSRANAVQDNLASAGGLTQPGENKILFLVPKNKTIKLNYQNQIRKSVSKSFLCLRSDTTEHVRGGPFDL